MINVKDFPKIVQAFKDAYATPSEKDEVWLDEQLCGPGTGIIYDEKTESIKIATGWKADEEGNIRRLSEFGPGVVK